MGSRMHVNANTLQRTPRFARIKSCTKTVPPVFSFSDFAIGSLGPVGRDAFSKVDTVQSSDRECTYKSICVLIGYAFLKPLRTSLQLIPALRPHLHSFSPLLISAPILSHLILTVWTARSLYCRRPPPLHPFWRLWMYRHKSIIGDL